MPSGNQHDLAACLPLPPKLSSAHRQMLVLLADGLSNKDIASRLRWTADTVRACEEPLFALLGTRTRELVAARAVAHRLVSAENLTDLPIVRPVVRPSNQGFLECMVNGLTVEQTASTLQRSSHTVRDIIRRLRDDLCAPNNTKAAAVATLLGLVSCHQVDRRFPDIPFGELPDATPSPGCESC
ncbi:LuxR C-terminal-related transcriptional regulator [Streptomyces sp. NPDC002514]|uniref:LuxR C-terminal-related transcriptional regulator n=1 Tax=Streptomyces sp. NPDC001270 TaxID=3364554 RepID=UPI0036C12C5C